MDCYKVAEHEGSGELLVRSAIADGVGDYRHGHCDSLVSAAGIAHCGECTSCHTGVRGSCRHGHRITEEVTSEDLSVVIQVDGPADLQTVASLHSLIRQSEVKSA